MRMYRNLGKKQNTIGKKIVILVLKYGTDVIPNPQTGVWLGWPESFVHNLAMSFAHKHLSLVICQSGGGCWLWFGSVKVG